MFAVRYRLTVALVSLFIYVVLLFVCCVFDIVNFVKDRSSFPLFVVFCMLDKIVAFSNYIWYSLFHLVSN